MASGHGGQRTPANPAPVSGPGALSRRTDGGPATPPPMRGDGSYGDSKSMEQIQQGADMRASTPAPIPFDAPSQSPNEPVTAGAALGAGIGPEAAGILNDESATLQQLKPILRSLELAANLPGSNPEARAFVRALRARLG